MATVRTGGTCDLGPVFAILEDADPDPAVPSVLPGYVLDQAHRQPLARLTVHVPGRKAADTEVPEVVELDLSIIVVDTHRRLDVPHMPM